ncbi:uncharacterized protein [Amphiura filiformis]|uniref:uncharacterized protein n=1 Tax=Amphiura filiformis TaxID=82378 RepID=UPI003B21A975
MASVSELCCSIDGCCSHEVEVPFVQEASSTNDLPVTESININTLPDEILLHIFSFLEIYHKLRVIVQVCKKWHNLAKAKILWRCMEWGLNFGSKTEKLIHYMDTNKIGQTLQFYKTAFHNRQLLHFLSSRCPNLKSLHLPCCYGNQLNVVHLPRCLTHLSIDFSLCGHVLDWERNDKNLFSALKSEELPNLTSLYIRGLSEDGQSGLDQFLVKLSQLKDLKKLHLHTISFRQEEIDAIRKDFFKNLPNLSVLILETCVILGKPTPLDFGQLLVKHSQQLSILFSIHSNFLTAKDLEILPDHPSLETLVLDWCPGLTLENIVQSLQPSSNLKQVYFSPYGKSETFKSDPFSYDIPFRSIHRSYKRVQRSVHLPTCKKSSDTTEYDKRRGSKGPQIFCGRKLYCHKYMRQIVKLLVEERQKLVAVRDNIKERMCNELGSISTSALNVLSDNSNNDSDSDSDSSMVLSDLSDSDNDSSCHSGNSSFPSSECSDCEGLLDSSSDNSQHNVE